MACVLACVLYAVYRLPITPLSPALLLDTQSSVLRAWTNSLFLPAPVCRVHCLFFFAYCGPIHHSAPFLI